MEPGLRRLQARRSPGGAPLPRLASTRVASLGFLTGLTAALVCLGLTLWPHLQGLRQVSIGTGGQLLGTLLLALAAVGLAIVLLLKVRALARTEAAELADLRIGGETLRALLGTTASGVILADPRRRIRLLNPAAEILFGRLSEETLGAPLGDLLPGLAIPGDVLALPEKDPASPRICHLHGLRGGEPFPLRLLLREFSLDDGTWVLVLAEDLTETERAEAQLDYLQRHDPLTGLRNRRDFERLVAMTSTDPDNAAQPHALCLMDLDHFKLINTACGHAGGDKLLKQVARILSTRLADVQAIARLGGDEFAALFGADTAVTAQAQCEDLVRTLRSFLFTWHDCSYDVSLSVGLVPFAPAQGVSQVLAQADIACQTAKAKGGDRVVVYSEDDALGARRQAEATLVSAIGGALDEGRFHIMAQPILALRSSDEPVHYEILVRMRDHRGNQVPPEQFIPAAERYILMPAVDRWILSHLLAQQAEQLRAWHRRYPDHFLFTVNLSATTLTDDGFLSFLQRQFEEYGVPYASICFEVTETAAIADLARARAFMGSLRALGSAFAVDDFGAGFASYAYLRLLPIQYLKIDGSFVRRLYADPVDRALVESINHIGHVLGLQTIAEWAETPEVVETLRSMGVDYAQGYGVGEPIALDQVGLGRLLARA